MIMKQQTFRRQLWLQLLMLLIPLGTWAQTTREVKQPQFGKQVIEVASDEVITFKDPKGDTNYTGTTSENAQSLTVFKPAEPGMSVQITFESMNMGGSNSYYSFANVYSGDPDADNTFSWATSIGEVSSSYSASLLPSGDILRAYPNEKDKTYTNETYTSAAADGSLSVGFTYRYAYSCSGWVAKVKVVKLENMTITGAGSNYEGIIAAPTERDDVALANAYVTATGVMNPDNVTGIWFTMTKNEGAVDPLSLKLYKGATQVEATVAADGDGYKFTLNEAPGDGTTTFTIKGDFLATAATGAKVEVAVTKVSTVANSDGVASFTAGTSVAVAAPAKKVLQPQFGKMIVEVADGDEIPFYDPWGTQNISGSTSYNAQSLVVFKPAEAGKSVRITFEELDLKQYGASYPIYLNIYDGVADADNSFTFATSTSGVNGSSSFANMTGTLQAEKINNDNKPSLPATYTSNASDGALSVGFLHYNSSNCTGWVAKVTLVQLESMTITGACSNYEGISNELTSKQNVPLANAYVTATGVMNPDNVTAIYFTMTKNEGVVDPTALKLYKGDKQVTATVEADGDNYKFVLNEAPVDGTTTFTIKGDFLGTAAIGAEVQVDITKITTATLTEGITPFTAGTSIVITNPALVFMTATPQTITVGETPLQFYDEGGKDGGIVAKTNGQVTFLPGVEGKKVMVDFTKNEIWHGSLYNQELRIYNGTEVNEANRIKTLQKGETGIVRSTAEDGSLTVVLFSDAQNEVAANGFEATVSLFTPQAMDFNGAPVVAVVEATQTVAGGDTDQEMITVNVKAQNTEPAMQVTKMTCSTGEKYQLVTKASLYFGTTKVGETTPAASEFTITLDNAQPLVEGDNIFTLKYDISDEAVNNEEIIAAAVSVTAIVNGSEMTQAVEENAPEATPTVKNIVLSHADQGTVTKTVNGTLAFETKPTSEYSTKYEAGTDTRTNIFVPKHEGMVCQIDFSSFAVYYASSTYGTRAKFEIYAGQGTTGTKLWELNDNAQQNVGPGTIIRSTAEDGALTVVFNPNASYSTYTLDGFKATVSEYQSKDMEVAAIEATQASTADASIGASNQELLNVNVKTEGNLNPLQMSSMTLNLKGTEANITKVSVWQGDNKLGEAESAEEVKVTFTEAVTLAEGDNLFVVKADVNGDAEENQTIDTKVVSVKVAESDITAESADPEGSRTLKNQVLMTAGNHGTVNLGLGKTMAIYDDGGPAGNGGKVDNAIVTFAPTGDADCIKLTGLEFSINYVATITIYKGNEANEEKKIASYSGTSIKFEPIISNASEEGGMLTVTYKYTGSSAVNFAMLAEGYKKSDVQITNITTEDISVSEVLKGQTDTKMLKITVEAKGELTPAEITTFNITGTDGVAVDNYHIYQTGTATSFSPVNEFNGSYSITESGTYYFWLTYDVKADAEVGQTATATVTGVVVNENTIDVTEPATATITVASGKSGTYTIGQGGDYATIQGAIDDIGVLGMEGPVTLKIKAGEYNEKVRIPYIKGMGAQNTLTLESESGQRDVKIYHNNYTSGGYSDDQYAKVYGVITLYEAQYVTLKDLDISTTDANYDAVVMVKNESRHITIDNCYLHAPFTATNQQDIHLVGHYARDVDNCNNDYLTVKNSLLEGGWMGVNIGGTGNVLLTKEVGGVIEGNTFKNQRSKAIQALDELGLKVRNNNIIIDGSVEFTNSSVGILDLQIRDEHDEALEITGNTFNVNASYYCPVINIRQLEATENAPAIIANNVMNQASLNASYSGIKFGGKVKNVNVAYNTIRLTGENGGAAFWASAKLEEGYGNINVVNNIIQNETSGYAVNLYNDGNLGTDKINFQNNLMYTAGETFFRAATSTTGDFDAFVTATAATGCVNKQVEFFEGSCEPKSTLDGDLLTAVALSYVTTDINGTARPAENITIGAYEYDPDVTRVPVVAEGYPKASATAFNEAQVAVKADMNGRAYVLVLPATDDVPSAETVKTDGLTVTLTKDTEATQKVSNLEESTEYVAYVLVESARGNATDVLATAAFTTPMEPIELMIACTESVTTVASGTETALKVMIASGRAPFTVTWTDSKHQPVSEDVNTDVLGEEIELYITPTQSGDYYVTVTDAQHFEAQDTCRIVVTGEALVADFENLYLAAESHWSGPDTKGDIEEGLYGDQQYQGSFLSGSYAFANNYSIDWASWSGFSYANSTATSFVSYTTDQWNNVVGGGNGGSQNYAVFFEDSFAPMTVTVLNNPDGDQLSGFYITNAAWTVDAILNGDGQTGEKDADGNSVSGDVGFRQGDFFKLTITADNDEEVEFYLADYRGEEADHYYVKDWQWVDLSTLGTVKELTFSLESSRKNSWGYTTPLYFCMDDFNGTAPVPSAITRPTTDETTDIEGYYDLNGRRIAAPQQGVSIVKMKNGATRKVIMK